MCHVERYGIGGHGEQYIPPMPWPFTHGRPIHAATSLPSHSVACHWAAMHWTAHTHPGGMACASDAARYLMPCHLGGMEMRRPWQGTVRCRPSAMQRANAAQYVMTYHLGGRGHAPLYLAPCNCMSNVMALAAMVSNTCHRCHGHWV